MRAPPEVRTPGGNRANAEGNHETSTEIIGDEGQLGKFAATVTAELALKGFSLYPLSCGGFLIARWDRTVHCSDLQGVTRFAKLVGARA